MEDVLLFFISLLCEFYIWFCAGCMPGKDIFYKLKTSEKKQHILKYLYLFYVGKFFLGMGSHTLSGFQ